MRDFLIKSLSLDELLERVPGWSNMPPAEAIAAVGKTEADDLLAKYFAAMAEEQTNPES